MATSIGYLAACGPAVVICGKEVVIVPAKIQALLIVLATIALAALNASSPWGP